MLPAPEECLRRHLYCLLAGEPSQVTDVIAGRTDTIHRGVPPKRYGTDVSRAEKKLQRTVLRIIVRLNTLEGRRPLQPGA